MKIERDKRDRNGSERIRDCQERIIICRERVSAFIVGLLSYSKWFESTKSQLKGPNQITLSLNNS